MNATFHYWFRVCQLYPYLCTSVHHHRHLLSSPCGLSMIVNDYQWLSSSPSIWYNFGQKKTTSISITVAPFSHSHTPTIPTFVDFSFSHRPKSPLLLVQSRSKKRPAIIAIIISGSTTVCWFLKSHIFIHCGKTLSFCESSLKCHVSEWM